MPFKKKDPVVDEAPVKKTPTRPWEKKHDAGKEWRPDYVRLAKKHPGFSARWTRRDRVEIRTLSGWKVADPKDYGVDSINVLDSKPLGNYVQRNELILMEIPEEMYRQRKAAMEARIKAAQRSHKEDVKRELAAANRELEQAGAEPAGLIDETEGIR